MVSSRSSELGPESRPVAIPDDFATTRQEKATGIIRLPNRVRWSSPEMTFDMDAPADRRRVYELVLAEGTEDDVRHFVNFDELTVVWGDLFLPAYVRRAWQSWFVEHNIDVLAC
jgi:hypothetical protein